MRLVVNLKVRWREGRGELRLDLLLPRPDEGGHRECVAARRHRRAHRQPRHQAEAGAGDGEHGSRPRRAWGGTNQYAADVLCTSRLQYTDAPRLGRRRASLIQGTIRVFTPPCHLSAYFCKPRRLPRFRCLNTPQHPSQRRNPSRRSPPSPTPLPTMPRVSLASRHQFLPAHTSGRHARLIVMHALTCWVR